MPKKKPKSPGGRPTKKEDSMPFKEICMKLAKDGKTNDEMAKFIGVSRSTLQLWKVKDIEFSDSLKKNQVLADELVEASLFRKATGYTYKEEKSYVFNGEVKRYDIEVTTTPETAACIFWLKNRQPEKWRDKREVELENKEDSKLDRLYEQFKKTLGSGD